MYLSYNTVSMSTLTDYSTREIIFLLRKIYTTYNSAQIMDEIKVLLELKKKYQRNACLLVSKGIF